MGPARESTGASAGRWLRRALVTALVVWVSVMPAQANHLVVRSSDIATEAVVRRTIGEGAVTRDRIRNIAVTEEKIRNNAVTTDKLRDGAVTEEKLDPSLLRAFHAEVANGPDDIAQATAVTTILTLNVPFGDYLLFGRAAVKNLDATDDATVRCSLDMDIGIGFVRLDSYPLSLAAGESKVFPLQAAEFVTDPLSITCNKGSSDTAQIDVLEAPRLTALPLRSIVEP